MLHLRGVRDDGESLVLLSALLAQAALKVIVQPVVCIDHVLFFYAATWRRSSFAGVGESQAFRIGATRMTQT